MKFLEGTQPIYDLTYNDVFLVPQKTSVNSRFDVSLATDDGSGTNVPIVVANMNAVAGDRMAETVARRGGIAVLPQDIPLAVLEQTIQRIKQAHPRFETPVVLPEETTVHEATKRMNERAHGAAIISRDDKSIDGLVTAADIQEQDPMAPIGSIMTTDVRCLEATMSAEEMYAFLENNHLRVAPVRDETGLIGIMTLKSCVRATIYPPNLDEAGRLRVAVAIGINGDVADKARQVLAFGADILVLDTAHGHQQKMLDAVHRVREAAPEALIVAGNVVTREATRELIEAGANIIKVGVGPGAMCTTRMMTGVGRPQFSAVLECATEARRLGGYVWADGGVRHPRDVALAVAAGASNVMFASWFAGTYESAADMEHDNDGRPYKENYGMASRRAVRSRSSGAAAFELAKKELFEEGISNSKMFVNPAMPGVEDIIDHITAGVRSACTYEGARTIRELADKSVIGIQSAAGFHEGTPLRTSW